MQEQTANLRILLTQNEIAARVRELGQTIAADYADTTPLCVCMLKGAVLFYTDLIRAIPMRLDMDFMRVSSYQNRTNTAGQVQFLLYPSMPLTGRHVILVEDIVDTGTTMSSVLSELEKEHPASLEICTLLDKPQRRLFQITPKYCGFTVPDVFVVGYGLDYGEQYRNLPYVAKMLP